MTGEPLLLRMAQRTQPLRDQSYRPEEAICYSGMKAVPASSTGGMKATLAS